jgi:DNA-binding transcriptional regulator YiaG
MRMAYVEKIKRIRETLFLSQEALAKELGVNLTTVNRWETGKTNPNFSARKAIHELCKKHGIEQ